MIQSQRSQPGLFMARVVSNSRICREHFRVTLRISDFPAAAPGQFVHILCRNAGDSDANGNTPGTSEWRTGAALSPLLRRPFSIGGLRRNSNQCDIEIVGRVVGPGTRWLDALQADDTVDLLGPLGREFTQPPAGKTALLFARGVGLPPMPWMNEALAVAGVERVACFGAQSRDLIPLRVTSEPDKSGKPTACIEEFARHGTPCAITTDDGTCGLKGRITHALMQFMGCGGDADRFMAYACGPEPMLEAVAKICTARGIACELAMERVMGCGLGTCQSCVLPVHDAAYDAGWRYALWCTEGPVFDARRVLFKAHV